MKNVAKLTEVGVYEDHFAALKEEARRERLVA